MPGNAPPLPLRATSDDLPAAVAAALASAPPDMAGARRSVIEAAGIPWAVAEWGDQADPALLLVHGVTSNVETFWRVAPAIAAAGYHVLAVDLPGHGLTGHWTGRHRFIETAQDLAAFMRAAGLAEDRVAVLGHSWGGMIVAALPAAGFRPSPLILLDPPALPVEAMELMTHDPVEQSYPSLLVAIMAIREANPEWPHGDIYAKALGLTQFDGPAARAVLVENGDWDGGLGALADPAAHDIQIWLIRGEFAAGGLIPDAAVPACAARIGPERILTIADAPHSPQRTHPEATVLAILRALEAAQAAGDRVARLPNPDLVDRYNSPHMDPLVHIPVARPGVVRVPPAIEGLERLAYNLYWAWHPEAKALFSRLDPIAWTRSHNPVAVLASPIRWAEFLDSSDFMAAYRKVMVGFDRYLANGRDHWFQQQHATELSGPIAYFCAEYGIHESLGIYSGGLGVLAGDHLKTASDMALPLVGVGLLYRRGYFRQSIDADGHQEHAYPNYDLTKLPMARALDRSGDPLTVSVELPGRDVRVDVWTAQVGRVPVLLLDTDTPENHRADRPITHILYVRGREMRLHQELVLGVGGVRAIRALGIEPSVWHLNEGHSAFLLAERAREAVAAGATLDEALERNRRNSVFSIHTPVAAGNERFDVNLIRRIAGPLLDGDGRPGTGGVPLERLLEIGRGADGDPGQFDMTAFSLRLTNRANAVSKLHAATANDTWSAIVPREILAVTNGIHTPTWVGRPIAELFERYLGADLDHLDPGTVPSRWWERIAEIPDAELWDAHLRQKSELAHFARGRLRVQLARHGEAPRALDELEGVLDPSALTIGFARRFATYKRSGMIFSDVDRLARLVHDVERPVQFIFAGKAHPADRPGQSVIQEIFSRSRSPELRGKVFILEDYDLRIGRFLVQGVDVWLNNPRRPLEASGTSGMKAAANGVVNASVLDGWWDEGFDGDNGWAIGGRESNPDDAAQDRSDADDLYRILEQEVIPAYYDLDADGNRTTWLGWMRRSMAKALWRFSTTRMLHEYADEMYLPAARNLGDVGG